MSTKDKILLTGLVLLLMAKPTIDLLKEKLARDVVSQWLAAVNVWTSSTYKLVDPAVILAMICQESSGKQSAYNPGDPSFGLLQITQIALTEFNNRFGKSYTMDDIKNSADRNLEVGIGYYQVQLVRYEMDDSLAVEAYNDGKGDRKGGGVIHWQKVQIYLNHVRTILEGTQTV
jgi:soluble lytic murein transglycosylase-like protein